MTEEFNSNKSAFIGLCRDTFDFNEKSVAYLEKRLSDEWEPAVEYKNLIGCDGSTYEDQRIRLDLDMADAGVQSLFERTDEAYDMFKRTFATVLHKLESEYGCPIRYKEFIENKAVFKKNITKIKKIFEAVYNEKHGCFENDADSKYTAENVSKFIVRQFERIGASKKSAKKLQLVISFNPVDWLLASTSENWSSCLNLANSQGGYQYCLGLPFLAGDPNRAMMYITDGSRKEFMGLKTDHFQSRTWAMVNKNGLICLTKWYPNDTIGVKPVSAITKQEGAFGTRESFNGGKYPIDLLATNMGAFVGIYSDMGKYEEKDGRLWIVGNGKDGQQVFTENLIDCSNKKSSFRVSSGTSLHGLGFNVDHYNVSKWRSIGFHLDMKFPGLRCSCGSTKGGFMFGNEKRYLCFNCYKGKTYQCQGCGEEYLIEEEPFVEAEMTNGKIAKFCPNCAEEKLKSRTCGCCGKYSNDRLLNTDTGIKICPVCLDNPVNGWEKCSSCDTITRNIKYVHNSYTKITDRHCDRCANSNQRQALSIFGRPYGVKVRKVRTQRIRNE